MAIMCGVVGALSGFYPELAAVKQKKQQEKAAYRLIAKIPTLAAMAYKTSRGLPIIYPRNDLSYAEVRVGGVEFKCCVECKCWGVEFKRCQLTIQNVG